MELMLRPGVIADAKECGRICYEAFKSIAEQHNFAPQMPTIEIATELITMRLSHPGFYSVVAELNGKVVGSIFLDERSVIAGASLLSIDPLVMNTTIGRQLMQAIINRAVQPRFPGLRGVVISWHYRALALYAKLGFNCLETFSAMQGKPLALKISGYDVRPALDKDLSACNQLCYRVHGHDRSGELIDAIRQETATIVQRLDRITGYSTGIGWSGHAVAESNDDLKALIGAAPKFPGVGFLVPSRNGDLVRWCLNKGLRFACQANLITLGLYNEPTGAYLPSITY